LYRKEKNTSTKKRILDSIASNSIKKKDTFRGYGTSDSFERHIKKLGKEIDLAIAEEYNLKRKS
jgi:hypothetical protein